DIKKINDTLGRDLGDKVLEAAGVRLKENTRNSDFIARMGGDKFALMMPEIEHSADAGKLATLLVERFSEPLQCDKHQINLTVSIGVVCFPSGDDNVDDLLKKADAALHKAKKKGKNQFQFFVEKSNEVYMEHMKLCSALEKALQNNEIYLCYQPQIDLNTGKPIGLEVLARWCNPKLGEVPPNVFIPIAEETGVIDSFGFWVINEACEQYFAWKKASLIADDFSLAINISPRQLEGDTFLDELLAVVSAHKIPLENINFELSESDFSGQTKELDKILETLKKHQIIFSIDDFGTSASSLSRLSEMPVDTLKIDQSFVQSIGQNKMDEMTIISTIALAKSLDLRVLAEGVETEEQRQFLITNGCAYAQGYYFSKPLSRDDMTKYLKNP
ncbi:MAG: bifunctional diguanylate cyclase/phosphodiesterase, partial [Legionella sp.]|nr:bifunctional diguanylate cyclase/phosphodiesterase [Legionella sp.]